MIRVGTDCSGIEAPIQALNKLKIPFIHEFSSETDKYCVESIYANYTPKIIFTDIMDRDIKEVPDIDLYICGFPCQPFSVAGKRKGTRDKRGNVFYSCLEVIEYKRPKYFILENVKGLLSIDEGKTFEYIIDSLEDLGCYDIYCKVLNTKDYGIPQNRERLFIVGIGRNLNQTFEWPRHTKMKKLHNFIDKKDKESREIPQFLILAGTFSRIPKDSLFINASFPYDSFINTNIISPCITTRGEMWCVPYQRRANTKELLMLQGFPKNFKQVVSDSQMKKQIGNSMSVNVLECLLKEILV